MTLNDNLRRGDGSAIKLWLLGEFRVAIGPNVVDSTQWRRRKASALVKLLALTPAHTLHREEIIDLLWPEVTPEAGANDFHQALHLARRSLGSVDTDSTPWLRLDNELVILSPDAPVWIDVEAFETAAAAARRSRDPTLFRQALELFCGELLPEDRYAEWAAPRREALHQSYVSLQVELAEIYRGLSAFEPAIALLQRTVADEPAHEPAHRALMELYALTGKPELALAQFERLRGALRQELAAVPDPATQHLLARIRAGEVRPVTTPDAAPPNNLPVQLTSFVGRGDELLTLHGLMDTTRLLTLTGPGGCGKTRLALQVAQQHVSVYAHGVWFVDLAPLADPGFVPRAVADALSVPEAVGKSMTDTLATALRARHLLVVLDNCEHLAGACAQLCDALLRACPQLQILATSREALHLAGEVVWLVPSLALPDPEQLPALPELSGYAAVRLFVERSKAVRPAFDLTPDNAAAVAQLCFHLDGIPLAIELAAARMNVLAAEQILARLTDRFSLLTRGSRVALNRQQTLQAAIDWSYELLSEPVRRLFQRLTVFAGGWTLEAAEAVASDESAGDGQGALAPAQMLDGLTRLVDQSLVLVDQRGGEARYRMLETIREYACQRLEAAGDAPVVQARLCAWCLALLEQVNPKFWGADHVWCVSRLEDEHENMRAALAWCMDHDVLVGLRLAIALEQFWVLRGYVREGLQWLQNLLDQARSVEPWHAKGHLTQMLLRGRSGDFQGEAENLIEGNLSLPDYMANQPEQVWAHLIRGGLTLVTTSGPKAKPYFEASLELARNIGHVAGLAAATHGLGVQLYQAGDPKGAEALLEQSVAQFSRLSAAPDIASFFLNINQMPFAYGVRRRWWIVDEETFLLIRHVSARAAVGYALANQGSLARARGNKGGARKLFEASRAHFAEIGDRSGLSQVLGQLGLLLALAGDPAHARSAVESGLAIRRELGDRRGIGRSLNTLAHIATLNGDYGRARTALDESLQLFQETLDKPGLAQTYNYLGNWALEQDALAQAEAFYDQSLRLFREFGTRGPGRILLNLAECARWSENPQGADARLEQAREALEAYGDVAGLATAEKPGRKRSRAPDAGKIRQK